MRWARTASAPILIAAALLYSAAPAMAEPGPVPAETPTAVLCGQRITTNAVLEGDLTCAAGNGLTLAGSATLDLGGHSLIGPGGDATRGITLEAGSTPTISNGTIAGWGIGVSGPLERDSAFITANFEKVDFTGNSMGARGGNSLFEFSSVRFVDNRAGFGGERTSATMKNSTFINNRGTGASVASGGSLSITNSTFVGNGVAVFGSEAVLRVKYTLFSKNDEALWTFDSEGSTFRHNNFVGNGTAYSSRFGSAVPGASDEMSNNRFSRNDLAIDANVSLHMSSNSFTQNGTAVVAGSESKTQDEIIRMETNRFELNGGDAVYIEGPAELQDTLAFKNRGHGIYAPLAVDLGGNVSYLNGRGAQCTGVSCLPR